MGVGMTIFTHVFLVRNVSKLPPNTCLERDKVRIQKSVIPNPGSSPAHGPPQPSLSAPDKCKHPSRKSLSTNIPRVTKRHSPSLPLCSHTTFLGLLWGRFMTASSSEGALLQGGDHGGFHTANTMHGSHFKKLTGMQQ